MQETLLQQFFEFGMAGLIGFALGLERDMAGSANPHAGTRDFILIALIGAVSAYLAQVFNSPWVIMTGFLGALSLLLLGYWFDRRHDSGITTEIAALLTYFLGVLIVFDARELAIALAIVTLIILSQKKAIAAITSKIKIYELQATLKFLVITFIVLPVFPNHPLSDYLLTPVGSVWSIEHGTGGLAITVEKAERYQPGEQIALYDQQGRFLGTFTDWAAAQSRLEGSLTRDSAATLAQGELVYHRVGDAWLYTMLQGINPYKIWLIVVLVSMISFVGYVAVKILGPGTGTGLTGLIGGLASSTVTTVSFARRSVETPAFNRSFAVAIVLASSIMFPRLLLEIAVVNRALMKNMAVPIIAMAVTGGIVALLLSRKMKADSEQGSATMQLSNPFCLKSAITFGAVFTGILIITRMATIYLGDRWLPLVAVISGLVDVDAIAFSLSDAQRAGIITLDWASFNLVLGAISNTMVKLFYVFTLGSRQLFHQLSLSFLVVSAVGIFTTIVYYGLMG